ncbi:MAG TPA: NAD(P)-dependent oxidoreductase [Burkholderiales bacterium]|nr:NAD(P)-dependent oxidoreductase [Burkholderiales bacterium]
MKVVITGSSGFMGSALIAQLRERGHEAHGIDVRSPRWRAPHPADHHCDITDAQALDTLIARLSPEVIVHLAARTDLSSDSVVKYSANIEGVIHLLCAAQRAGSVKRVLWTSSQLVSRVGRVPTHDLDFEPNNSYGESKVIGERIVRGLDGGGMEWVILRPTTVWGPGMSDHYVSLLRLLSQGRYFHAGGARARKSFSYIYNAIYQIQSLMAAPSEQVHRQTFYVADSEAIDLRGWCDALSDQLGARHARVIPKGAARALAKVGDALKATVAPDFKFTSFRLRNILTPYVFDTRNLQAITGPLPHDQKAAVQATADWYLRVANPALKERV